MLINQIITCLFSEAQKSLYLFLYIHFGGFTSFPLFGLFLFLVGIYLQLDPQYNFNDRFLLLLTLLMLFSMKSQKIKAFVNAQKFFHASIQSIYLLLLFHFHYTILTCLNSISKFSFLLQHIFDNPLH